MHSKDTMENLTAANVGSSKLYTPVMSRIASPTVAAATLLTPRLAPPIHRPTVIRKAKAVIFSSLCWFWCYSFGQQQHNNTADRLVSKQSD